MAIVTQYIASVQVWDSARKLGSASFYVSETDAKAYAAAADSTARAATKVGLLLTSALNMTEAEGTNFYYKHSLQCNFINNAAENAPVAAGSFNSNRWKVTVETTNNGLPATDSIYIPMRDITQVSMEGDGVSVNMVEPVADDLIVQILDTALSKYGTAITGVASITVNDV